MDTKTEPLIHVKLSRDNAIVISAMIAFMDELTSDPSMVPIVALYPPDVVDAFTTYMGALAGAGSVDEVNNMTAKQFSSACLARKKALRDLVRAIIDQIPH